MGLAQRLRDVLTAEGADGLEAVFSVKPFIGAGRARDMVVNVALPFLHALANLAPNTEFADQILNMYRSAPGLAENEVTREMRKLVGMSSKARLSARRHQGLMHLYRFSGRTAWE